MKHEKYIIWDFNDMNFQMKYFIINNFIVPATEKKNLTSKYIRITNDNLNFSPLIVTEAIVMIIG